MKPAPHSQLAIIGGGPAGMIAAYFLADHAQVDLYEQGRNLGRKFLVAGDGGLNITNSAMGEALFTQYTPPEALKPMLDTFGPSQLREWLATIGVPTFVGTSGRVFPQRGIKPAEVLKAITDAVKSKGVRIHTDHRFIAFDGEVRPIIASGPERSAIQADAYLFALGGASWPKTGSTGEWTTAFTSIGIQVQGLQASNCGVMARMPESLRPHFGKPLKNIAVGGGGKIMRGELTITEYGLEGNAIYPVVPQIREQLSSSGEAQLTIDLKPDLSEESINAKLKDAAWKERTAALRLERPALALLKAFTPLERYLDGRSLAHDVKQVRVPIHALRPIEEAISTAGGIAMNELNEDLSLKEYPHLFVAGEMVDWDAPTGGFLLQGAFTTGFCAAQGMLSRR